jgi:type IV secretory pathway TraG/TraD family ATPase VirD4
MEMHLGKEEEMDKQAKSVLGTMLAHIGVTLEALSKIDGDFSFKEWTKSEKDQRSIFLLGEESVITSLLPLYRVAVEIVASELLAMPDDTTGKRELFFWLDELPKLKKVSKVIDLMTLARSKGGRVIYSIQTLKQLSEVYGKEGMYTILDTSNTLFIFRTTDANELENILGKQEVLEYSESRTWGPHDMRDGGSHSKQKKTKPLVLASDIQRLENLEFYIKSIAPDITKAKLQYIGREEINPKFVPNIKQIQKRSVDEDSETDESENRVSADDFMDDISSL